MKLLLFIALIIILPAKVAPAFSNDENSVEIILNEIRLKNNRQALKKDELLTLAAQAHAKDMRYKGYFSHTGLNGSNHFGRIKRQGYTACYTAENIAKGQKTPAKAMADWMRSEGHRHNILSGRPIHYGLGISGNVWVMLFAKPC